MSVCGDQVISKWNNNIIKIIKILQNYYPQH